jgi:2-C-methyl-D-erythritol 4-phosphate cytidylyltransferase
MGQVAALIPSAGLGLRMKSSVEKPYIQIGDRPVMAHTLEALARCPEIDGCVLVVEPSRLDVCRSEIIDRYGFTRVVAIVPGGQTRQESVYRGLQALDSETDIVVVHDAARPCVDPAILSESIRLCHAHDAVLTAVPVKDTVKEVREGRVSRTLDRSTLWLAQTPQTFRYALLKEAHEQARMDGYTGTDDAALIERMRYPVTVLMGDYENLKITTPEDLETAAGILRKRGVIG